jgi:hypothetical protein
MTKLDLGNHISYDPEEKGYVMFDLTSYVPTQAKQIVDGIELFPKNEYHTSLVAIERYIQNKDEALKVVFSIKAYLETHDLEFVGVGQERYVCKRDERTTVIAPVTIKGIEEFRSFVSSLIPGYDPPFSHITLLKSKATEFGIGINSMDELHQYCAPLDS